MPLCIYHRRVYRVHNRPQTDLGFLFMQIHTRMTYLSSLLFSDSSLYDTRWKYQYQTKDIINGKKWEEAEEEEEEKARRERERKKTSKNEKTTPQSSQSTHRTFAYICTNYQQMWQNERKRILLLLFFPFSTSFCCCCFIALSVTFIIDRTCRHFVHNRIYICNEWAKRRALARNNTEQQR